MRRGRRWLIKRAVRCEHCDWKGFRGDIFRVCPNCEHWYPRPIKKDKS